MQENHIPLSGPEDWVTTDPDLQKIMAALGRTYALISTEEAETRYGHVTTVEEIEAMRAELRERETNYGQGAPISED